MLEKIRKIKENKILKIIWNIIYTIILIIVLLMFAIVIMQRVTNNNLTIGGIRMFTIATGSMVPVYNVGDVLFAKEVDIEKIKVGDDIAYQGEEGAFEDKVITHRVIFIEKQEDGNYKIITQGIANNAPDPEIDQTQVYGKIVYKSILMSFLSRLTRNIYTFYFIIFIPITMTIYRNIEHNIKAEEAEAKEEEEKNEKDRENTEKN